MEERPIADKPAIHEDLSRESEIKIGSERIFGLVFAVVFLMVGLWPLVDGEPARLWALVGGVLFSLLSFLQPRALSPLNRIWFRLGKLLHAIVNPLVLGLLFYTTVTPTAFFMRLIGKDTLHRSFEPEQNSYWIVRKPSGPDPSSMKNQF